MRTALLCVALLLPTLARAGGPTWPEGARLKVTVEKARAGAPPRVSLSWPRARGAQRYEVRHGGVEVAVVHTPRFRERRRDHRVYSVVPIDEGGRRGWTLNRRGPVLILKSLGARGGSGGAAAALLGGAPGRGLVLALEGEQGGIASRPAAAPVALVARPATVEGALPADAVARVLRRHEGSVRACMAREGLPPRTPVTLSLVIDADGRLAVVDASVPQRHPAVGPCLSGVARAWRFPAAAGSTRVRQVLELAPAPAMPVADPAPGPAGDGAP